MPLSGWAVPSSLLTFAFAACCCARHSDAFSAPTARVGCPNCTLFVSQFVVVVLIIPVTTVQIVPFRSFLVFSVVPIPAVKIVPCPVFLTDLHERAVTVHHIACHWRGPAWPQSGICTIVLSGVPVTTVKIVPFLFFPLFVFVSFHGRLTTVGACCARTASKRST